MNLSKLNEIPKLNFTYVQDIPGLSLTSHSTCSVRISFSTHDYIQIPVYN